MFRLMVDCLVACQKCNKCEWVDRITSAVSIRITTILSIKGYPFLGQEIAG